MEARRAPILAHGVLACVAWGVLMPAAAVLPRFWRAALPKWWFPLHRGLMLSGVTVALTSFVVIVSTTHSAHFDGAHKLGGLILTIVLCLQPLNAFARPHKPAAGEEKGRGGRLIGASPAAGGSARRRALATRGTTGGQTPTGLTLAAARVDAPRDGRRASPTGRVDGAWGPAGGRGCARSGAGAPRASTMRAQNDARET